jgi:hypothetical protein
MTEILSLIKTFSAAVTSLWERSSLLLWGLAASCFLIFITLAAGSHWQAGDTPALFASYGTMLVLAFIVLFVFAAIKTYSERPKPTLSLLAQEGQSFCGQTRQKDGTIITQLTLRFLATNLTDGAIVLSSIEIHRPFVRRRAILTKQVMVRQPNGQLYSSKCPIEPQSLTYGSADIFITHPVGSVGKTMRAVVAVQDHLGRWHKLIFSHLPIRGAPTVDG